MQSKLMGIVEADETFVGGKHKGMRGGPVAKGTKTVVFTLIQRNGEALSQVVPDVKARTLKGIIRTKKPREKPISLAPSPSRKPCGGCCR